MPRGPRADPLGFQRRYVAPFALVVPAYGSGYVTILGAPSAPQAWRLHHLIILPDGSAAANPTGVSVGTFIVPSVTNLVQYFNWNAAIFSLIRLDFDGFYLPVGQGLYVFAADNSMVANLGIRGHAVYS